MTRRDEVIRMAREAGFDVGFGTDGKPFFGDKFLRKIERFAALVAAAEREKCAKACIAFGKTLETDVGENFAEEIRALKDGEECS